MCFTSTAGEQRILRYINRRGSSRLTLRTCSFQSLILETAHGYIEQLDRTQMTKGLRYTHLYTSKLNSVQVYTKQRVRFLGEYHDISIGKLLYMVRKTTFLSIHKRSGHIIYYAWMVQTHENKSPCMMENDAECRKTQVAEVLTRTRHIRILVSKWKKFWMHRQ